MLIALLSVVCAAQAAEAFHPWGLNDSKAFVFPRIAEKRNRGRRERLATALRNDADATQRRRGGREESLESSEDCEFEVSTRATRPANADTNNRALRRASDAAAHARLRLKN